MPLRLPRFLWRVRFRHPAALLLIAAVSGTSVPPASAGSHATADVPSPASRTLPVERWLAIEASVRSGSDITVPKANNPVAAPILRPGIALGDPTRVMDTSAPIVTLAPLTVELGALTVQWSDTDGAGSGIARRNLTIETAPATPTGCGPYRATGGVALEWAEESDGHLSLGTPPTTGCLRVSLAVTDRVGRTSIATSEPFRIQPPIPVVESKPAAAAWSGTFNLYRANAFVTQKTFTWCVAASVQMMVNLVRKRTDRSRATQARMIAYAQRWDNGPYGAEGGTDVTGWIAALRHYGAGRYRVVGANTPAQALRIAATAMRQTGRPAGILVMEGRHAWILHGFESRTDPRKDRRANITAVRVSGPLYPVQQKNGYDQRPNTRLTARALEKYFLPTIVGAQVGKYVVVIPTH